MLSPDSYESLPAEVSRLLLTFENFIIADVARRMSKMGALSATSEYQLLRLSETRQFDNDFRIELAETSRLTTTAINKMFEEAAKEAYVYDKRLFEAKGVPMVPYEQNQWLRQITHDMAEQSNGTFQNLTRTVGFTAKDGRFLPPREYFANKLSNAEFQVASGVISYDAAIKNTVRELVDSGLKAVAYPYARPWSLEASVRANILTGISNLAGEVSWRNIEDLGVELIETSAHATARPAHQVWQGKRFALNGTVSEIKAKYEEIREADAGVRAMRRAEAASRR